MSFMSQLDPVVVPTWLFLSRRPGLLDSKKDLEWDAFASGARNSCTHACDLAWQWSREEGILSFRASSVLVRS